MDYWNYENSLKDSDRDKYNDKIEHLINPHDTVTRLQHTFTYVIDNNLEYFLIDSDRKEPSTERLQNKQTANDNHRSLFSISNEPFSKIVRTKQTTDTKPFKSLTYENTDILSYTKSQYTFEDTTYYNNVITYPYTERPSESIIDALNASRHHDRNLAEYLFKLFTPGTTEYSESNKNIKHNKNDEDVNRQFNWVKDFLLDNGTDTTQTHFESNISLKTSYEGVSLGLYITNTKSASDFVSKRSTTYGLREEEKNYDRNRTVRDDRHTDESKKFFEVYGNNFGGVLRAGPNKTKHVPWADTLHKLPRFNFFKIKPAQNRFDLSLANNYVPGIVLYAFPGIEVLFLCFYMWKQVCRVCPRKRQIYRRCDMWRLRKYKKCAKSLVIPCTAAIIFGIVGIYFAHDDLSGTIDDKLKPLLEIVSGFVNQLSFLRSKIFNASSYIKKISKFGNPQIKDVAFLLKDSLAEEGQFEMEHEDNITVIKNFEGFLKRVLRYERIMFWVQCLVWFLLLPFPIILMVCFKKYTYHRIRMLNFMTIAVMVLVVALMLAVSSLFVVAIGISDFCQDPYVNFVNLSLIEDAPHDTVNYYLTGADGASKYSINFTTNKHLLIIHENMVRIVDEYGEALDCTKRKQTLKYDYDKTMDNIEYVLPRVPQGKGVVFEMHFSIESGGDAFLVLSPKLKPKNKVYEFAIGVQKNTKTEIRRKIKGDVKSTADTPGILNNSTFEFFYIIIKKDGYIEFGKDTDDGPISVVSFKDPKPLNVTHFGFASIGLSVWKYECPEPYYEVPAVQMLDVHSVKQANDDLLDYCSQIAESHRTHDAFLSVLDDLCDSTVFGLTLQAVLAGPITAILITLMLMATCKARTWQKALLCIFLLDGERCFTQEYNCVHKPCQIFETFRKIAGQGDVSSDSETSKAIELEDKQISSKTSPKASITNTSTSHSFPAIDPPADKA